MPMSLSKHRSRMVRRCGAVLLTAMALGGCSTFSSDSSPQATATVPGRATTFRERMTDLFFGPSAEATQTQTAAINQRDPNDECPGVDIRTGASTLQFAAPGAEPSATSLRYQVNVARTARECAIRAGTMTMKIGVQGRVILGPAGGPGQLEVPLRYALVREGVEPKTIWTQLYKIPVAIPPNQTNVPFMHLEENVSFLLPSRNELAAYVVYVGFDQMAAVERPARKTKAGRPR
jgi:hypothetical protein